ncbi:MAG: FAD-dependent oxidoreductase [Alphaproteobacteria bacterium]|nr:FAD-dependent oxidoreductase [Alphaproteobacteria bacterium]
MSDARDADAVVIGGGFFGCATALYLRSVMDRVVVVEARDTLLDRASRVNQARVHTGFHYPRSFVTALRSKALHQRFARDFPQAIVSDFDMLYAVAAQRSKVSARRFHRFFQAMDAPMAPATTRQRALFAPGAVEDVFACKEFAFDWRALRDRLHDRLRAHGVRMMTGETVASVDLATEEPIVHLQSGGALKARCAFNVTYANLNAVRGRSGLAPLALKHELSEVALVRPPADLGDAAVTVVDGPFFSAMPYPADDLYSLTHVRYTPHYSWIDDPERAQSPDDVIRDLNPQTRWKHMMMDARRIMPCVEDVGYVRSLYEVKTVLIKNERDDGRPILVDQPPGAPRFISVMGAKIDNIYDLFEMLPGLDEGFRRAHMGLIVHGPSARSVSP